MLICIVVAAKLSTSMTKNIRVSIGVVSKVADGDLNVWVDDKLLKRKDEIGELSKVTITLRDTLKNIIQGYFNQCKKSSWRPLKCWERRQIRPMESMVEYVKL